jgi:glycosyltransferase involved in cell wall biosynthesis
MRVGLVVHTFDKGGLERGVANLANHLDRSLFEPVIICLNRSGTAAEWLERSDVRFVELHKRPGNDWRLVRSLRRTLRDENLGVVHSRNWGTLLETVLARRAVPRVAHVHAEEGTLFGGSSARGLRRWMNARLMNWALSRCSAVVAVAERVRERVSATARFPASRIEVIPNGVPVPEVQDRQAARLRLRVQLGIPDEAFVLGSVGRLVAVKNFGLAIKVIDQLRKRGVDARLVLVGDGPERSSLEAFSRELGVSHLVYFAGEHREVGAWLAALDLYVNTSASEGMSQSLLEAMGFGLPAVVTDVGDSARLVGGEAGCGLVVSPGDDQTFADAVERFVRNAPLREACGSAALQRHGAMYSVQKMVDRFQALYLRLSAHQTCEHVSA